MTIPASFPTPPAPAPEESHAIQELSMPIFQVRNWLKFLGVMNIISGIPSAIVLVGFLQIWLGVLLFQAGSSIESANRFGDKFAFLRSMGGLKTYFIVQGVLMLVGVAVSILMLCLIFVVPLFGLSVIPWQDIINNFTG